MVGLDVLTTLLVAAKTLYEMSQEAKESHEECFAIHSTVTALAKTLQDSLSIAEHSTASLQSRLTEITKYVYHWGLAYRLQLIEYALGLSKRSQRP